MAQRGTKQYTLATLAQLLGVDYVGDADRIIDGLSTLASAGPSQLAFLANPKYQSQLIDTRAGAVIVHQAMQSGCPCDCLVSPTPYETYAQVSQLFAPDTRHPAGIHPSAVIGQACQIAAQASIAANVVIGDRVVIAAGCSVGPGTVIGNDSRLGENCLLHANVTLYHDVLLGDRCILHSAVVIGSDGFGFAPVADRSATGSAWVKIAQLGGVRIGNDVEIGANTSIDRGALDNTVIGNGVIIDNQVQIAHNVLIGDNTAIAACTAIAGSTNIGTHCTISGGVGIAGHLHITDKVHITAMTMVSKSIKTPGSYSSGTGMQHTVEWRKNAVRFSQLDKTVRRLSKSSKES